MALKDTLKSMLIYAEKHPGEAVRQRLVKGLEIAVKIEHDKVSLQLSRNDVYPSTIEWKTVISCWPEPIMVDIQPKPLKQGYSYYLQGRLNRNGNFLRGKSSG